MPQKSYIIDKHHDIAGSLLHLCLNRSYNQIIHICGNKLRTYRTFKNTYITEPYVHIITQKKFRSAYAKFRCGVAPINIDLCRYGLARIPVEERLCSHCNEVEDELHVLMHCPLYDDICNQLTLSVNNINPLYY